MSFIFSGHETFPCRYAWLPKGFNAIHSDPNALNDMDEAMVTLGVGKNMVRAIRFWIKAAGIAESTKGGGLIITEFANYIFSKNGLDPFLEDIRTLWLIHWQLSTHIEEPLFAWDYMLNKWQYPEINRVKAVDAFQEEAGRLGRDLSLVTLEQHFDIFLHTYVPTRSRKGDIQEDNLDCPLVELELIQKTGERKINDSGKRETLYAFRREEKPEITPLLFIYCLNDFWLRRMRQEKTLSFRDISFGHGSPGQIFKLPETDIRQRLETIETDSDGVFSYRESASLQQLTRNDTLPTPNLSAIYDRETIYA